MGKIRMTIIGCMLRIVRRDGLGKEWEEVDDLLLGDDDESRKEVWEGTGGLDVWGRWNREPWGFGESSSNGLPDMGDDR